MRKFLEENCPEEWLAFIDHHKETKQYKSGDFICTSGQVVEGLHILNFGKVKVIRTGENGVERVIRLAGEDDILGHRGFGGDWTYPISAIALAETETMFIPLPAFNVLARAHAPFVYKMMMFFAEELRRSESLSLNIPVKNRISRALLCNFEAFGLAAGSTELLSHTLSRREIASFAQTTYESVIRVLSDLNKTGVIRLEGKSIAILNLEELKALAEGQG